MHPSPIPNSNSSGDILFSGEAVDKNKAEEKRRLEVAVSVYLLKVAFRNRFKSLKKKEVEKKGFLFVLSKHKFLGANMPPWEMYEILPFISSL